MELRQRRSWWTGRRRNIITCDTWSVEPTKLPFEQTSESFFLSRAQEPVIWNLCNHLHEESEDITNFLSLFDNRNWNIQSRSHFYALNFKIMRVTEFWTNIIADQTKQQKQSKTWETTSKSQQNYGEIDRGETVFLHVLFFLLRFSLDSICHNGTSTLCISEQANGLVLEQGSTHLEVCGKDIALECRT